MVKLRIAVTLLTVVVLVLFGTAAIYYARGYRLGLSEENEITLTSRGLLVANSDPNGAQVFVDSELQTATNNTVSLAPGKYSVEVKKEGFLTWGKELVIEKETVTQIDAFLVSSAPSLTALTFSGVFNPQLSPDFSKIAYGVPPEEENSENAGLWVLEMTNLPLGFNRDPRRITDGDLSEASWEWSPDGREILLTTKLGTYLLNAGEYTAQSLREGVTAVELIVLREEWEEARQKREAAQLSQLVDEIEEVLSEHAVEVQFSPDENRILYTASGSATLAEDVVKQLPGSSTQKQEREIKDGGTYVYDIKEDRNFAVAEQGEIIYWLPNSLNLVLPKENKIVVMDYDGTNKQTVFSGNYEYPHAYPSTSANQILVLTNLGGQERANLYWLGLK